MEITYNWKPSARAVLKGGPNRRQQNRTPARARLPEERARLQSENIFGPQVMQSLTQSVSQTSRRWTDDRPQEKLGRKEGGT